MKDKKNIIIILLIVLIGVLLMQGLFGSLLNFIAIAIGILVIVSLLLKKK